MAAGRASFEIQTSQDGRWTTEEICHSESAAKTAAKTILGARTYVEGVRVLKSWDRADGLITENVIYTEMRQIEAPRVNIVPIEEAPVCHQPAEYYQLDSRITVNRLFRKYLEKVYLTPTELMHNYRALRKVQEVDGLVPAAVDRVATIQAKAAGNEPKERREEIHRVIAQMAQRARRVEEAGLPALKGKDLDVVFKRLENIAPPDEVDYYATVVLANDLIQYRDWLGKLERLVELVPPQRRGNVMSLLDGVIADLMGVPTALQDILGFQRNLAQAICAIADLCEGHFDAKRSDAREQMEVLNPLLADGQLAETRKALHGWMLRQLAGSQPLSRNDPSAEKDAFREVVGRLMRGDQLLGGGETAAALTRRFARMGETGGTTALREAVGGVCGMLTDSLFRVIYLTELLSSPLGTDLRIDILNEMHRMTRVLDIDGLTPANWAPRDKMQRITRLYRRIAAAEALPGKDRTIMLDNFDRLLADFLRKARIIERLDDPALPLRQRAQRLVEFCASGLLPPQGKSLALARDRVITLLRQPNFESHLVEDLADPAQCEETLRGFHALLVRAGFK